MSLLLSDVYRFDEFELVLSSRAFSRSGSQLALSPKAFEVLTHLVINPGRVVTKEEILKAVWPESFVEESNLAQHVSALRKALADRSSYIVTIPGRGYQFTAKVRVAAPDDETTPRQTGETPVQRVRERTHIVIEESLPHPVNSPARTSIPPGRFSSPWIRSAIVAMGALTIACLSVIAYRLVARHDAAIPPRISDYFQITHDGREKYLAGTDGSRLYFTQRSPQLAAQVSVAGGVVAPVPVPIQKSWLGSVSPDGSTILVISEAGGMTSADSMWSLGVLGSPLRHLADAVASTWSPDGETVAYATREGNICLIRSDGTEVRRLASIGGFVNSLSWSPDGAVIRFSKNGRLWEIASNGAKLHQMLDGWRDSSVVSEGRFGPDGRFFFVADGQIWTLDGQRGQSGSLPAQPVLLTSGPIHWEGPTPGRDQKKIFAVGTTRRGELVRSDFKSGLFMPFLAGISAEFVSFSRDGKSVAYVSYPEGILWRAKRDGSEALQLTRAPVYPKLVRWSPDGTQILFVDRTPKGVSGIYVVSSEGGGVPTRLLPEDPDTETDPSWSPDGRRIAFSTSPEEYLNPKPVVHIFDLATHQVTTLPGSGGLYSPRWSPDGRRIVASTLDSLGMRVFDFATRRWSALNSGSVAFPEWSHDSRSIDYVNWGEKPAVLRISATGGKPERVADLEGEQYTGFYSVWMGLDPTDAPMMLRDRGSHDIYALTLDPK
jgi:DNA-binding winged helix-turn-helix (wHTH) protein/Tol biopolymer transport system component